VAAGSIRECPSASILLPKASEKKAESTESYSYLRRTYNSERQSSCKMKEQRSEYNKGSRRRSRRVDYVEDES
jgi:hypothetical protein